MPKRRLLLDRTPKTGGAATVMGTKTILKLQPTAGWDCSCLKMPRGSTRYRGEATVLSGHATALLKADGSLCGFDGPFNSCDCLTRCPTHSLALFFSSLQGAAALCGVTQARKVDLGST